MQTLNNSQVDAAALADWRKLAQALHARFDAADPAAALRFLTTVADAGLPVEATVGTGSPCSLGLIVCTRQDGRWVTSDDLETARAISAIAADHALTPRPELVTQLELALDTAHEDAIAPFWAALLTGDAGNRVHDTVFDPHDRVPSVWFQSAEDVPTPSQRWHGDLWLAPETAAQRIAAAVAAGGRVVYDDEAPAFVVLADPDGNRVCVCTSAAR